MRSTNIHQILGALGTVAALAGAPMVATAQVASNERSGWSGGDSSTDDDSGVSYKFKSRADSISWMRNRKLAKGSDGFRIVVSLQDRHVWAMIGSDTVLSAPAAVAKGTTLEYGNSSWK